MSIKSKVLAAAAVLTLAGGLSAAGTVAASAATPQCANKCLTPRSAAYPGFVETALFGIPLRGVPTIVSPAAGWNPAEDFTVPTGHPVTASYFSANGMVSAAVASQYGGPGYLALQIEYAPYGKPAGLCSGIATTAYQDEALSLQPCSTPDTTVWILDFKDSGNPGNVPANQLWACARGDTTGEIARSLRVAEGSVRRWHRAWRDGRTHLAP
jgi:hypothetical protein